MKMLDKKGLEKLANCAMCANMCKHSCPTYLASGNETLTPQKIARLILYEEKGFLEDRRGFSDVVFQTTMCGACMKHCIYDGYDLRLFMQMGRSRVFEEGLLPAETMKRLETFKRFGNPHGERKLIERGMGTVGYFISCSVYKDEQLLRATDRVVSANGRNIQQFGGADICCGAPLYYMGDNEGFKAVARKMREEIEKRGLKRLVVACPNCIKMMKEVYPEAGLGLSVELVHAVEYLAGLLKQRKIAVKKGTGSATYHDPCILVNDLGIVAPPRSILRALGYEIREPVYAKVDTHCCGGLPGARVGFTGLVDKVKSMRTRELRQTGADVYVSACPTCKAVLSEAGLKDLIELVAEHLADE